MLTPFRLSVAPMMDVTTPHFNHLLRLLDPAGRWTLYTAMINAGAIIHSPHILPTAIGYPDPKIIVQIGASNAKDFSLACLELVKRGWRRLNVNCGCPSKKVEKGHFGASLMIDGGVQVKGMLENARSLLEANGFCLQKDQIELSVKCRAGVIHPSTPDGDTDRFLETFIDTVISNENTSWITVHARPAILASKLSAKSNRTIPNLNYERFNAIQEKYRRKGIRVEVNGGIATVDSIQWWQGQEQDVQYPRRADGVMIGRKIMDSPFFIAQVNQGMILEISLD